MLFKNPLRMTQMASSRIFVKNLPPKYDEEKIKELFKKFGNITDLKLFKKNDKSRRCAFVGFSNISQVKFFIIFLWKLNTYKQQKYTKK